MPVAAMIFALPEPELCGRIGNVAVGRASPSLVASPDFGKGEGKASDRTAALDGDPSHSLCVGLRTVHKHLPLVWINEPAQSRAIRDPILHLLLRVTKTVRPGEQLDHKIRAEMRQTSEPAGGMPANVSGLR